MQLGTTSKTFFPGVRLGWAAAPAEVSAQLVAAKQNTDQCAGALGQRLFEEYVRRGWIDEQLAALARSVSSASASGCSPRSSVTCRTACAGRTRRGGFFTWLTLPEAPMPPTSPGAPSSAASASSPARSSSPTGEGSRNVRLSFSLVDEALIDDGIERLARDPPTRLTSP